MHTSDPCSRPHDRSHREETVLVTVEKRSCSFLPATLSRGDGGTGRALATSQPSSPMGAASALELQQPRDTRLQNGGSCDPLHVAHTGCGQPGP